MRDRIFTILAVVVVVFGTSGIAFWYYDQWSRERLSQMGYDDAVSAYESGDHEFAFKIFFRLARLGNSEAQRALAQFYEQGISTEQNYYEAMSLRFRLADRGDVYSMYRLGWHYEQMRGTSENHEGAIRWYRRAAEQGNVAAQTALGSKLIGGFGVEPDPDDGLLWLRKAIDSGDPQAMSALGRAYQRGSLGDPDYRAALRWCLEAAKDGDYVGLVCTIELLRKEDLPTFDLEQAYVWSLVARHWWRHDPGTASYFDSGIPTLLRQRPEFDGPSPRQITGATEFVNGAPDPEDVPEEYRDFLRRYRDYDSWPVRLEESARRRAEATANGMLARWPDPPMTED